MDLDVLKVKFTHSNTVRDKKPYTIYEIEVRSSSTITWVIYKRYSHFHDLHAELVKAQLSSNGGIDPRINLPMLPPKRLTRSLAVEFVEKRKNELQDYLRALLDTPGLVHSPIILSFLQVPDSVRPMLAAAHNQSGGFASMHQHKQQHEGNMQDEHMQRIEQIKQDQMQGKQAYQHKSVEERRVLELLNLLKFHPNKVAAIKNFEEFFFEKRPRYTAEFICLLLQGKSGGESDAGLIQTCGDVGYSHVASRAALFLLNRLLDIEKNKDAHLFLEQFLTMDVGVLKQMHLSQHIVEERGNRLAAFRILTILRAAGPDINIEKVVADAAALKEYYQWSERKNDGQVVSFKHETQDTILKSLSLIDLGYKTILSQTFSEVQRLLSMDEVYTCQPVPTCAPPLHSPLYHQFRIVPCPPGPDDINEDVSLLYKKDVAKDMVIVKMNMILPWRVEQVSPYLLELHRRREWDLKFHRASRLQQLDAESDVVHMTFKSFSSPYKYRDFVLLRGMQRLDAGAMLFGARSVLHSLGPEFKDNVRAVLFPTGYALTPLPDQGVDSASGQDDGQACLMTFVAQMDRESALIVSPDLLGETNELRQTFNNIKTLLTRELGMRSLRPSKHTAILHFFTGRVDNTPPNPITSTSDAESSPTLISTVPSIPASPLRLGTTGTFQGSGTGLPSVRE